MHFQDEITQFLSIKMCLEAKVLIGYIMPVNLINLPLPK